MEKNIRTEIEINASAEKVWQILSDFESFPRWNPFIVRVKGAPIEGDSLRLNVQLPNSRMLKLKADVLKVKPEKELRWAGGVPINLFRGEHFYVIESLGGNKIRFVHGENFSGWLVRTIWFLKGKNIEKGYELMNEALKKHAEGSK